MRVCSGEWDGCSRICMGRTSDLGAYVENPGKITEDGSTASSNFTFTVGLDIEGKFADIPTTATLSKVSDVAFTPSDALEIRSGVIIPGDVQDALCTQDADGSAIKAKLLRFVQSTDSYTPNITVSSYELTNSKTKAAISEDACSVVYYAYDDEGQEIQNDFVGANWFAFASDFDTVKT